MELLVLWQQQWESATVNWPEVEVCFQGWWEGRTSLRKRKTFLIKLYFHLFLFHLLPYRDWCWGRAVSLTLPSGFAFRQVYFDTCFFQTLPLFHSFYLSDGKQSLYPCAVFRLAGAGSPDWKALQTQIAEHKALCQVAQVERDRLLELVAVLQKR